VCVDADGDPAVVAAVLARHRRRVEARSTRLRGHLHAIDHLLASGPPVDTDGIRQSTGKDVMSATEIPAAPATGSTADPERTERQLAVDLFNGTWRLMEADDRTPADDDRMLHMAHASRYHWERSGAAVNLARGEWLCARIYAVLERGEPSLHHARRVLELCHENGIGDWDLAFGHEAVARAYAVSGDRDHARAATEQALACAEDVEDPDDRELLMADLETIPHQPRFW
jgi:hypothetical protein